MDQVRTYFQETVQLSDHDWAQFSAKLVEQQFAKRTVVLPIGQTESYLSFIQTGMIRFSVPSEEKDITFGFGFENEFASAYDSFITQTPTHYQVETLAPTTLWRITYADLQTIYATTSVGNHIGRLAAESIYIKKARRELSLLTQTPQQRYLQLLTEQQKLLQLIPLKYLASYIGITPQALSRIRARII